MATSSSETGARSSDPQNSDTATSSEPRKLSGNLGTISIVFTVLAFNAPLAVASGFVPILIGFGNQDGAPATFLVVGALLLVFAVGLIAMSRFMHSPGAFYSYISAGLGRIPGLSGAFTAMGAYTVITWACYPYMGYLTDVVLGTVFGVPHIAWWVYALAWWAIISALTLFHIELSAKVLGVALVLEVCLIAVWCGRVLFTGGTGGVPFHSFTLSAFTHGSVSSALLYGVFCITGFEAIAVFRAETRDPVKTIPRATYTSVLFMCGIYCLTALAFLTAFGAKAVVAGQTDPAGSFLGSVATYLGTFTADLASVLLLSSGFASVLALHNISARYLYTLGSDGVLPRPLGRVHQRHGSPFVAAALFAVVALIGFLVPLAFGVVPLRWYASLSAVGSVCLILLYVATSLAVIRYFRRDRTHTANVWQATLAPVLSMVSLVGILYLAVKNMKDVVGSTQTVANWALTAILVLVLSGALTAAALRARRPETFERIGSQDIS